jgi:hypothetical protein
LTQLTHLTRRLGLQPRSGHTCARSRLPVCEAAACAISVLILLLAFAGCRHDDMDKTVGAHATRKFGWRNGVKFRAAYVVDSHDLVFAYFARNLTLTETSNLDEKPTTSGVFWCWHRPRVIWVDGREYDPRDDVKAIVVREDATIIPLQVPKDAIKDTDNPVAESFLQSSVFPAFDDLEQSPRK